MQPGVQSRTQLSSGSCWCQEAAVGSWCWALPILADGAGIPLTKVRALCTPPGCYSHPTAITNWNKVSLPGREDILVLEALLSIIWLTPLFQLNSHAHVHWLEDNLAEANAQLAAEGESQAENEAIRLQGKFLTALCNVTSLRSFSSPIFHPALAALRCLLSQICPILLSHSSHIELVPLLLYTVVAQPKAASWAGSSRKLRAGLHRLPIKLSLTLHADDLRRQLGEESKVLGNTSCLQRLLLSWVMPCLLLWTLSTSE